MFQVLALPGTNIGVAPSATGSALHRQHPRQLLSSSHGCCPPGPDSSIRTQPILRHDRRASSKELVHCVPASCRKRSQLPGSSWEVRDIAGENCIACNARESPVPRLGRVWHVPKQLLCQRREFREDLRVVVLLGGKENTTSPGAAQGFRHSV